MPPKVSKATKGSSKASPRAKRANKRAGAAAKAPAAKKKKGLPLQKKAASRSRRSREEEEEEPAAPAPAPAAEEEEEKAGEEEKEKEEEEEEQKGGQKGKRERNFIEEEDVYLCISVVNVSQDGGVATNQKRDDYWDRIHGGYTEQQKKDTACKDQPVRSGPSLRSRFERKIRPAVLEFNRFYKAIKEKNESGKNKEDWMREAHDKYLETHGHGFAFTKCVEVLWNIPKFGPDMGEITEDATANQVDRVDGPRSGEARGCQEAEGSQEGSQEEDEARCCGDG